MDWNRIRDRWQESDASAAPPSLVDVQARDRAMSRQVRRRDFIETLAAAPLIPVFGWVAWSELARGEWWAAAFAMLLTAWCASVPVHLWRARRRLVPSDHALAPARFLAQERDAMRAQSRLLEQVWLWYLAPCVIGVTGLVLSKGGVQTKTVVYAAVVIAFSAVIGWANRVAARRHFGVLADDIQKQIDVLTSEDPR